MGGGAIRRRHGDTRDHRNRGDRSRAGYCESDFGRFAVQIA
jgi:hypothetical protein